MREMIFGLVLVFGSGFVAALNMTRLVPTSQTYEAAWWKVGVCVALMIFGVIITVVAKTSCKKF